MKIIKDNKDEQEIKIKFKEILVRNNCLKENDELTNELINVIVNS